MNVLVVDDSSFARKALVNIVKQVLPQEDLCFAEAASASEATSLFKSERPELVFLDMTLPDGRGQDIAAEMKQLDENVRIIVVSADIQRKTHEELEAIGIMAFVPKPVTAAKLSVVLV